MRIKNGLNIKKASQVMTTLIVVFLTVLSVGLAVNYATSDAINALNNNASYQERVRMANVWAEALKTRDGKPRYDMMSQSMKAKFREEQIERVNAGADWNYNIGVSSPWVVSYTVEVDGMTAKIIYLTTTSVPNVYYNDGETVIFGYENGKLVVVDSYMDFEGRRVE